MRQQNNGRLRGSVSQLNEKYTSLASDASSSDDHILAESFFQFADHYYRLHKEIEMNAEKKEIKQKSEPKTDENNIDNIEVNADEEVVKKPSRKKRGFEMRQAEFRASEDKVNINNASEIKDDEISVNNVSA